MTNQRAMKARRGDVDRVFHALADPTRRAILTRLGKGPQPASALAEPLAITLTAVMQHVQVLEQSGLVQSEKVGRVRTCRVRVAGLDVLEQWIRDQRTMWEKRLDQLGELLDEE
jgi:DNA-binding transcriptional ArsR family regulator